jgi:alkylation response protein AidB-like acyl-CoA dehydrogenase
MDHATAQLFASSLRRALASDAPDAALADVGWREALSSEGLAVAALLFAEQGSAGVSTAALDDVLADALGLLSEVDIAVVLPEFGSATAPGRAGTDGWTVRGLGTARLWSADTAVVVAAEDGTHRAALVETARLRLEPISGIDPELGLVRVSGVDIPVSDAGAADWPRLVATGQVALAHELLGAGRTMLALAREHALTRVQFGQPIAAFQAVRHRLADGLVALDAADALVGSAADPELSSALAAMGKATAGRAARTVARHAQQVLAGVGFTAEHRFHRFLRRVIALDGLFGDARTLTRALGEELLRTRRLPAARPL